MSGHCGHGVRSSGRFGGGSGSSSSWVIERAPSRRALPTQSAPVSPPPITTTSASLALIGVVLAGGGTAGCGPTWRATQRLRSYR